MIRPKGNTYLRGWYKLRWEILLRDNFTCQYCGGSAPNVKLEVDHKISIADGGDDSPENLVASCWACNRGKSGLRQSIVLGANRKKEFERITNEGGKIRNKIKEILKENPSGLRAYEIGKRMDGIYLPSIRVTLFRMLKSQEVNKKGKIWSLFKL
jgi:hypothetical protein